jgi:hypothetical protein
MRNNRTRSARVAAVGIWAVVALVCVAIVVAATGTVSTKNGEPAGGMQDAVRQTLRENAPSGEWDEIQWWDEIDHQGHRIVRLKYRTKNPFGGDSVLDEVFELQRGKAVRIDNIYRRHFE